MNSLIKSRGYFWWSDESIPKGHFAPPNLIAGELEITSNGHISLKLDALLPEYPRNSRVAILHEHSKEERSISGILIGSNQSVLLIETIADRSTIHSDGPSTESYVALYCLIARKRFLSREPKYQTLQISLEGYEDWLALHSIKVRWNAQTVTARYSKPKGRSWQIDSGRLLLKFDVRYPRRDAVSTASISERCLVELRTKQMFGLERAAELASRFEDFMIILTNSERGLDFPRLKRDKSSDAVELYYRRMERSSEPLQRTDYSTRFTQISDMLGTLFQNWLTEHEYFGPGFHLYLGNRRQMQLYPEHRFASLVWGLESLNRRLPAKDLNSALQEKVERIVQQVSLKKDRIWLEKQLRSAVEPSLAVRLSETFSTLPFAFDVNELKAFSKRCAERRNDISHYGGSREHGKYENFVVEINQLSRTLDLLYHAKLLQLIGIPDQEIRWWFVESFRSFAVRSTLKSSHLTVK